MKRRLWIALAAALTMLLWTAAALAGGPTDPSMARIRRLKSIKAPAEPGILTGTSVTVDGPQQFTVGASDVFTITVTGGGDYRVTIGITDEGRDPYGYVRLIEYTDDFTYSASDIIVDGDYSIWVFVYDAAEAEAYLADPYNNDYPDELAQDGLFFTADPAPGQPTFEQKVSAEAQSCVAGDDWHTVLNIHDYLTHHMYYDYTYEYHGADGFLRGKGVCDSYSKAFRMFCDAAGIPSDRLISDQQNHAWNGVCVGGTWYMLDATWDDAGHDTVAVSGNESYDYFCISQQMMYFDHYSDAYWEDGTPHSCPSLAASYIVHEGLWEVTGRYDRFIVIDGVKYLDEVRTLKQDVGENLAAGQSSFTLTLDNVATTESGRYTYDEAAIRRGLLYNVYGLTTAGFAYGEEGEVRVSAVEDLQAHTLTVQVTGWAIDETGTLVLPADTLTIGAEAFAGTDATRVEIPEGCTSLGDRAFAGSAVRTVVIPSTLTNFGENVFYGCGRLIFITSGNPYAEAYAATVNALVIGE